MGQGQNNQYINIKDIKGVVHKWLIEDETERTYKIFCNGFVTQISKKHTYMNMKDEILCTSDIRNPWCTLDNERYMKAAFFEIWKEK